MNGATMALKLANLETLAPDNVKRLEVLGISNTDDLLLQSSTKKQREALAARSGLDDSVVLRLARIADLARIVGLIEPHVLLLDPLGVTCVRLLAEQDPSLLVKALRRKNVELQLVRSVPPESTVARWIADAKALPGMLDDRIA